MSTTKYTPRLASKYKAEVVPALMKRFGYKSIMQVPKSGKNLFEPWRKRSGER
jgi:large subunit ribosomal protein L5